eukprot:366131-Chlamydomonas_euryale.AAC.20
MTVAADGRPSPAALNPYNRLNFATHICTRTSELATFGMPVVLERLCWRPTCSTLDSGQHVLWTPAPPFASAG